jgi:hypothetical protein
MSIRPNRPSRPHVFHEMVKEGFPFLGKREPWMGLSFQACWLKTCPQRKNSNSISSRFPINNFLANQLVAAVAVTSGGIYVTYGGNITTLRGHSVTFRGIDRGFLLNYPHGSGTAQA